MSTTINGTTGVTFPDATIQNTAASGFGFKNRIINGACMIDQRNAGASVTPASGAYTLDRWIYNASQASKVSIQQNAGSVTPAVGFSNYLGVTSLSAYSVGAGEFFLFQQKIEGFNISDLAWGTANAATVTLSFKVYSSLTGTFSGSVYNASGTRRYYPFTYTVGSANTWTTISVVITGCTDGTWAVNNTEGLNVDFCLGVGSTYGGQPAGAWTGSASFGVSSAVSVVGTNGATFYITGVQLEKGSTATSFDYRPYGTELALCQRYYQQLAKATWEPVTAQPTGASNIISCMFKVSLRASPSVALSNISVYGGGTPSVNNQGVDGCSISFGNAIGNSQWFTAISSEL